MKQLSFRIALASAALAAVPAIVFAQGAGDAPQTDLRAQRRAEAVEAARHPQPGEGNPVPEAGPKASRADRAKARQARRPAAVEAARSFKPGEGDPRPAAGPRIPRAERRAERTVRRAEIKALNKSGRLPVYGESYGAAPTP